MVYHAGRKTYLCRMCQDGVYLCDWMMLPEMTNFLYEYDHRQTLTYKQSANNVMSIQMSHFRVYIKNIFKMRQTIDMMLLSRQLRLPIATSLMTMTLRHMILSHQKT